MRHRSVHPGRAPGIVCLLALSLLVRVHAADAQIVANGKTLTVTTTNAVATFNGPDLVGFVNSVTSETYLKKPSNGDLVQVDAIGSTGQSLQSSSWSVGTEAGTGVPLATITTRRRTAGVRRLRDDALATTGLSFDTITMQRRQQ